MTEILDREHHDMMHNQLGAKPKDIRAQQCNTLQELEVFNMSSNYQGTSGGNCDFHTETGILTTGDESFVSE